MHRQRPNSLARSVSATWNIFGFLRRYLRNNRFGLTWRIEETATLVALFMCAALSFTLYLSTLANIPYGLGDKWSFHSTGKAAFPKPIPAFRLSGIELGMTPIEVGSVYPSISMSGPPTARQTGRIRIGNGDYSISFMEPEAGRKSYRIHYTEIFSDFTEREVLERLSKKFGPPEVNQCGPQTTMTG